MLPFTRRLVDLAVQLVNCVLTKDFLRLLIYLTTMSRNFFQCGSLNSEKPACTNRIIARISVNINPSWDIVGRELASVCRYPNV